MNPEEIADISEAQNLIKSLLNLAKNQSKIMDEISKENQDLGNEIKRMKGKIREKKP